MMKVQAILCFLLISFQSWATAFAPSKTRGRMVAQPLYSSFPADQFNDAFVEQIFGEQVWNEEKKTVVSQSENNMTTTESVLLATNAFLISTLLLMATLPMTQAVPASYSAQDVATSLATDDATLALIDQSAGIFFF